MPHPREAQSLDYDLSSSPSSAFRPQSPDTRGKGLREVGQPSSLGYWLSVFLDMLMEMRA